MKNIITTAALLAAGTALANALTIDALFNSTSSSAWDKANAYGFNFSMSSSSVASDLTGEYSLGELIIAGLKDNKGTLLSATDSVVFYKKEESVLSYKGVGSVSTAGEPYVIYGTDYASNNAHKYTMGNGQTARVTGDDIRFDVNATYSVFFVTTSDFEANRTTFETATAADDFSSHLASRRLAMGLVSDFPEGNIKAKCVDASGAEATPLYSPYVALTATSIPEPSAFGLLAGIGALALVASRRRRKA